MFLGSSGDRVGGGDFRGVVRVSVLDAMGLMGMTVLTTVFCVVAFVGLVLVALGISMVEAIDGFDEER